MDTGFDSGAQKDDAVPRPPDQHKLKVAIVFDSGELSCKSSYDYISDEGVMDEVSAVRDSLRRLGHEVVFIPVGKGLRKFNQERVFRKLKSELTKAKPDVAINLCETVCGYAKLQHLVAKTLDSMGIPYTGSDAAAIELTTDKMRTKEMFGAAGIPTPSYMLCSSADDAGGLEFPLIVKPNFEDGSVGIELDSVVRDSEQLKKKVSDVVAKYNQPALVERYIDGRELNVAVFINNGSSEVLPLSEIEFRNFPEGAPKITSYAAKWLERSDEYKNTIGICTVSLPPELEEKIKAMAYDCIKVSGCRDYARVDVRLDKDNNPYVLEVNANPDISPGAGFMRSFSAKGGTFDDLVRSLLELALERSTSSHA